MLKLSIQTIPHHSHRYPTVGDYSDHPDGSRSVRVSEMQNVDYEFLVAVHECVEQHLCLKRGISEAIITDFDKKYEAKRPAGDVSEPGDDPAAPYQKEHQFATKIEKMIAEELGINWSDYEDCINGL